MDCGHRKQLEGIITCVPSYNYKLSSFIRTHQPKESLGDVIHKVKTQILSDRGTLE